MADVGHEPETGTAGAEHTTVPSTLMVVMLPLVQVPETLACLAVLWGKITCKTKKCAKDKLHIALHERCDAFFLVRLPWYAITLDLSKPKAIYFEQTTCSSVHGFLERVCCIYIEHCELQSCVIVAT